MSVGPAELKAVLRRHLRTVSKNFSPTERADAAARICLQLKGQEVWRRAESILFYVPMSDEPDIGSLMHEALSLGKIAALPAYSAREGHYLARQVRDITSDLQPGQFGIPEPTGACPIFELNRLDLILVPGIGFSFNGHRLGRGKGFYDRLLKQVPRTKCGIAFDWQVTSEIPAEPHDICMNFLVTPTRWHQVVH